MTHSFERQKAETYSAFAELEAEGPLPDAADLDLFFVPQQAQTDWNPVAAALSDLGLSCHWIEADGDEGGYLIATLSDQPLSALSIWMIEELASRSALENGFTPDGWGFSD